MESKEVVTKLSTKELRELAWEGHIGFTVKAKDNDINQGTHEKFKFFCKENSEGNYTLGLKILLDMVEQDYKYLTLYEDIIELRDEVEQLKEVKKEKTEDKEPSSF